MKEIILL